MACALAVCTTGDADYEGNTGDSFEIAITSSSGTATLNVARYNGTNFTTAPWKFTIAGNVNVLVLVIESTVMGDRVSINEVTSGCNQVLDSFHYSPSLAPEGLEIKGL